MTPLQIELDAWSLLNDAKRENEVKTWVDRMEKEKPEDARCIAMALKSYLEGTQAWAVKKRGAKKERVRRIKEVLSKEVLDE